VADVRTEQSQRFNFVLRCQQGEDAVTAFFGLQEYRLSFFSRRREIKSFP
jgi:hypothetical protein